MTVGEFERIRQCWEGVAEPAPAVHGAVRRRLLATVRGETRPSGPRRHARLLIAAAVVVGLVAAMPALSGTGYGFVVHWLTGTPPKEVSEDVARFDQGAPPGMAQHPIVGETGLVYRRDTDYGQVRIWLTPTKSGGFCETFEAPYRGDGKTRPTGGGCFPARMRQPIEISGTGGGTDFGLGFIEGRVAPPISRLELLYVNGGREDVPVQGGFFVAVVEKTRILRMTDHPHELVGYDDGGKQVATASVDLFYREVGLASTAPPVAETDREQTLLSVDLDGGSAVTMSASPSRAGGECDRISSGGTDWCWTCADSARLPQPLRLSVVRPPIAGGADAATVVYGIVRHGLTLTFGYEDGTSEQVPLTADRFLVDLTAQHRQPGRRLAEVTVSGARGPVLHVPIATEDDSLYSSSPDRAPQPPMHQIFNPTDLPVVATLKLTGSHGERIEFLVRRETPTHWYEVLSVDGTVVSGSNLKWFPGGHDATIGLGWQPMQKPEFDVSQPLSLLMGDIREPATAARVVYADGSSEPLELARPSEPVAHGLSGWFVYEMTPARRTRHPVQFEALDARGKVVDTATPPKGA